MIFFDVFLLDIIMSSFIAVILDFIFSEVKKYHPLVGFGRFSSFIEKSLNRTIKNKIIKNKTVCGCIAWLICVLPFFVILLLLEPFKKEFINDYFSLMFDGIVLYFVIGHQSLKQHALNIFNPLNRKDDHFIMNARKQVAMMVSRETNQLSEHDISRATVESVLENGHDAVIASLFWYAIGGLPFAILHRLANTLDAMWGYKNKQFTDFGWCAAIMDDWLGWPSAKITALLYAIQGAFKNRFISSLSNAKKQSQKYKSLNGGWVMAAGATVLNVQVGGQAVYDNQPIQRVTLGVGEIVISNDILRSIKLVLNAVGLWFCFLIFVLLVGNYLNGL